MNGTSGRNPRCFYGWSIVSIAFFAHFMSVGTNFYIYNAFMEPLCSERGFTRAGINLALMLGTMVGFAAQFFYGTLLIRVGPRIMMTAGGVLAGVFFIFLGRVDHMWQFYVLYLATFLANMSLGGIVANTAVNNWFVIKRGKALGLATAGVSLSGAVIPVLAMLLVKSFSLESAFLWLGVALVLAGPVAWLVVRNWPEDYGLLPDNAPADDAVPQSHETVSVESRESRLWSPRELFRTGAFWKLGFAYALVMMSVVGVMPQLKPRFSDIGFSDNAAMAMMASAALLGTMGKYFWGMLCDRHAPRRVASLLMCMCGLGLAVGLVSGSAPYQMAFAIIFGFAMGGVMSTFPVIIAFLFGRASFAAVFRLLALFLALEVIGYALMSASYEVSKSYDIAYYAFVVLDLMAAFLVFSVRKPETSVSTP
ncbi:MAG: MFS transporter [bacterium]